MKLFNKLSKLMISCLMVMSMGITAFADGETTTYTISTADGDTHTYEVYQILTGDLSTDANNKQVLSNVVAGQNFKEANAAKKDKTNMTAAEAAEYLADSKASTDSEKLEQILKFVDLTGTPVATIGGTDSEGKANPTSASVAAGYYLIKDKSGSLSGKDDAYTTYIVKVVGDQTIERKADKPSVEKKVKDVNDSVANSTTDWQDSADYDLGDAVPFKLTATLPSDGADFAAYSKYKLVFHDVESAGLTFNFDSVVVKYGETTLDASNYTVNTSATDGCTFEVTINDVKALKNTKDGVESKVEVAAGGKFTVEYTATLNENAVIGSAGNPNEVYLEYSNNPNAGGEGETGKTPKDKVIVFTYKVVVNKVDKDKKPLEGAGFTLYKKYPNAEKEEGFEWKEVSTVQTSKQDDGSYTSEFLRVDDGDYKLVETTVPAGYNKMDDVEFTIDANHDVTSDDPTLSTLTGGGLFTGKVDTGALTAEIENKPGSSLPETGGIGTTIFYIVGGALMIGAAVLLVNKNKKASN